MSRYSQVRGDTRSCRLAVVVETATAGAAADRVLLLLLDQKYLASDEIEWRREWRDRGARRYRAGGKGEGIIYLRYVEGGAGG